MKKILLTKDKIMIVDDADYEFLKKYKIHCKGKSRYYAGISMKINGKFKDVPVHRLIMEVPNDKVVDHINGNGLDNRRCNLRIVTQHQNTFNMSKSNKKTYSKYKGLTLKNDRPGWVVRIKYNDRHIELGSYKSEEKAASIYNFASRIFFGKYRKENVGKGVTELSFSEQYKVYKTCRKIIEKNGWYIDTEVYHSFFMIDKEME